MLSEIMRYIWFLLSILWCIGKSIFPQRAAIAKFVADPVKKVVLYDDDKDEDLNDAVDKMCKLHGSSNVLIDAFNAWQRLGIMDYIFPTEVAEVAFRLVKERYILNKTRLDDTQGSWSSCSRFLAFCQEYRSKFDRFMERYSRVGIYPIKDVLPDYCAKTCPIAMLDDEDVLKSHHIFGLKGCNKSGRFLKKNCLLVRYHSGGFGMNPHLFECGELLFKLTRTWTLPSQDLWASFTLTVRQLLVSIQDRNFEALVVGHFRNRACDILMACKAYMDGLQVGGVGNDENCCCSIEFRNDVTSCVWLLVKAFNKIGATEANNSSPLSAPTPIRGSKLKFSESEQIQLGSLNSSKYVFVPFFAKFSHDPK
ncbi:hypothetical protein L1987_27101 [Smallanthus sonchifolius]|uniref:Uncharacterized protein n=1 Tax=Smallanthus sonchifolius TaxID=185202 RepID=A0ACB9IBX3_9ASTR|nr:hypothetical protein L1987_27101 [Smallanthus sonchifolius]